ncbi:MAG: hypothetical protein ACYC55_04390 [Candidatus Geothermincolia bacterium]
MREMTAGRRKALAALLGITGLGTELFWVLFFTGNMNATETPSDDAFERAFPAADTWMAFCCFGAARHLPGGRAEGYFYGVAAGSGLIFLALMDILYGIENRKYWPLNADRAVMAAINLWTLGLGAGTLLAIRRALRGSV